MYSVLNYALSRGLILHQRVTRCILRLLIYLPVCHVSIHPTFSALVALHKLAGEVYVLNVTACKSEANPAVNVEEATRRCSAMRYGTSRCHARVAPSYTGSVYGRDVTSGNGSFMTVRHAAINEQHHSRHLHLNTMCM